MARTRKARSLTKAQKKDVKKLAMKVFNSQVEDKSKVFTNENLQLFHNKPLYALSFLSDIQQGVNTGDSDVSGPPKSTIRLGDEIRLKNINIRFWLSNKLDRPNVMYKGVLFWYPSTIPSVTDAVVYLTQTNKMLDRYNHKVIKIIDQFIVKSGAMYLNGTEKFEHSYLATLNKSYKNKKITYDPNGKTPKGWNLGFAVVCYDAYGTLQTDNIASFAYQSKITFEDA